MLPTYPIEGPRLTVKVKNPKARQHSGARPRRIGLTDACSQIRPLRSPIHQNRRRCNNHVANCHSRNTEGQRPVRWDGRGNARCSAFHPTDPAFEPSLHQHKSLPAGNAILRGRDKGPERALEVQSAVCRDKMRARIPAGSGLFTPNREISVCLRLRGGAERTRTSNQTIISRQL
jgi:hypothetical protein